MNYTVPATARLTRVSVTYAATDETPAAATALASQEPWERNLCPETFSHDRERPIRSPRIESLLRNIVMNMNSNLKLYL